MLHEIQTMIDLFDTDQRICFICDSDYKMIWANRQARESELAAGVEGSIRLLTELLEQRLKEVAEALDSSGMFLKEVQFDSRDYLLRVKRFSGDDQKPYSWWGLEQRETQPARVCELQKKEQVLLSADYRESVFHIYNALPPLVQVLEKYGAYNEMLYLNIVAQGAYSIVKTNLNAAEYVGFSSGDNPMHRTKIRLREFMRQFAASAEALIRNSGRQLVLRDNCGEDLCVSADKDRLLLALLNLLVNAVQFSIRDTEITLDLRQMGKEAVITVHDVGDGIESSRLSQVGTPFYSYNPATKMRSGVGLGLYVAKEIVRAHEGSFFITSQPNRGTTVSLRLPGEECPPDEKVRSVNVMEEMLGNKMSMLYAFLAPVCGVELF